MATSLKEIETFSPANRKEWRRWLEKNHDKKQSVWIIQYKKQSNVSTITWSEAVDEALCFGWIDSTRRPIDEEKFMQFFTRRKPNGTWSKVNKEKVQRFLDEGLIAPAGLAVIEAAQKNGSWYTLDEVEELTIPADLEKAFKSHKGSKEFFHGLSRSVKKHMLQWIVLAKRPETRQKRITEIVALAAQGLKPKQF